MFDFFNNLRNNKLYLLILLSVILIFIGLSYYYYNNFVKSKINDKYVANKEFIKKSENDSNNNTATLYFFFTTWCPHCKVARPQWEKIQQVTGGVVKDIQIIFKEVDCDKNTEIADKFNVSGYPTIKLVHNNKIYDYDAKPNVDTLTQFLNSVIQ